MNNKIKLYSQKTGLINLRLREVFLNYLNIKLQPKYSTKIKGLYKNITFWTVSNNSLTATENCFPEFRNSSVIKSLQIKDLIKTKTRNKKLSVITVFV